MEMGNNNIIIIEAFIRNVELILSKLPNEPGGALMIRRRYNFAEGENAVHSGSVHCIVKYQRDFRPNECKLSR